MKVLFHRAVWLMLVSAGTCLGWGLEAQVTPTNGLAAPPFPAFRPPTEVFRGLLAMSSEKRGNLLTNQQPELRQKLEAKIREYQAMTPEAREARLHATELHEYLVYFLKNRDADRQRQLELIPAEYKKDVADRLTQFDLLPPSLRDEAMARESTASYFVGPSAPPPRPQPPVPPPPMPPDPINFLNMLSAGDRAEMFESFDHFFDLGEHERQQIIAAIPSDERAQVARTLAQIGRLPREQREQSLQALSTLAAMTDQQRQMFFNSADRWKAMSPADRETWLKVVSHLPVSGPPLPPARQPPLPPVRGALSAATNPGQ